MADQIPGLGQLGDVDLAAPDQIEDELAELCEGVLAPAPGARLVELLATGARAALDRVTNDSSLLQRGPEEGAERSLELGGAKAATASLLCHGRQRSTGFPPEAGWDTVGATVRTRWFYTGLVVMLAACPPPEPPAAPIPPVSTGKVRVRVFTEPSPVRMLASAERFVFVATEHDLERFDDGGGVFALTSTTGLSGSQVLALGPDPERRMVWILTDGGLGRYAVASEVYSEVTAPPAAFGLDFAALAKDGASVASAKDGGAWIGTSEGLIYVSAKGGWTMTPIKEAIRAMTRDHAD